MSKIYKCSNYRQNVYGSICGSSGSRGTVVADLYLDGKYVRMAVVADCGSEYKAKKYASMMNALLDIGKDI